MGHNILFCLFLELIYLLILIWFLNDYVLFRIRCHFYSQLNFLELIQDIILIYSVLVVCFDVLVGMWLLLMVVYLGKLYFLLWGGFLLLMYFYYVRSVHFVHDFIVFAEGRGWKVRVNLFVTIVDGQIAHILVRRWHWMVEIKGEHFKGWW